MPANYGRQSPVEAFNTAVGRKLSKSANTIVTISPREVIVRSARIPCGNGSCARRCFGSTGTSQQSCSPTTTTLFARLRSCSCDRQIAHMQARPPTGHSLHALRPDPGLVKARYLRGHRSARCPRNHGRMTIGVWVGWPDGAPAPGLIGRIAAAPILFDAFARTGKTLTHCRSSPGNPGRQQREVPVAIEAVPPGGRQRLIDPPGPGFARLTVIDATGAADTVVIRIQ